MCRGYLDDVLIWQVHVLSGIQGLGGLRSGLSRVEGLGSRFQGLVGLRGWMVRDLGFRGSFLRVLLVGCLSHLSPNP